MCNQSACQEGALLKPELADVGITIKSKSLLV